LKGIELLPPEVLRKEPEETACNDQPHKRVNDLDDRSREIQMQNLIQ
jgi:hypothetical protein